MPLGFLLKSLDRDHPIAKPDSNADAWLREQQEWACNFLPHSELLVAKHVLNLPFNSVFLSLQTAALFWLTGLFHIQFSSQFYTLASFSQNGPGNFSFDIWHISAALLRQMLMLCPALSSKNIIHATPRLMASRDSNPAPASSWDSIPPSSRQTNESLSTVQLKGDRCVGDVIHAQSLRWDDSAEMLRSCALPESFGTQ